jgi:hypothetical protein
LKTSPKKSTSFSEAEKPLGAPRPFFLLEDKFFLSVQKHMVRPGGFSFPRKIELFFFIFRRKHLVAPWGNTTWGTPGVVLFPSNFVYAVQKTAPGGPLVVFLPPTKSLFFWVIQKKALGGFFFPPLDETAQWAASGVFLLFSQRHQIENFFKLTISSIMFFCLVFFS